MRIRIKEIDSLRGIAALMVVIYHYTTRYNNIYGHIDENYLNFWIGKYGVQLFFLISGFVMMFTLEQSLTLKNYIFKRSLRIYPAYVFCVLFTSTIINFFGLPEREVGVVHTVLNLFFLQGFLPNVPYVDGVYWTLIIEILFYIIIGIIILTNMKDKIIYLCLAWIMLAFLYKINLNIFIFKLIGPLLILPYCNLFILGILVYKYLIDKQYCTTEKMLGLLSLVLCLVFELVYKDTISCLIVIIFIGVLVAIVEDKLSFLNNKIFLFLGSISYPLYLIHQNLGYLIINRLEKYNFTHSLFIIIPIIISILLAYFISNKIEKPVIRYFNKMNTRKFF